MAKAQGKGARGLPLEDARAAGARFFSTNEAAADIEVARVAARAYRAERLPRRLAGETPEEFAALHQQVERAFLAGVEDARLGALSGTGEHERPTEQLDRREVAASLRYAEALASETFDRVEEAEACLLAVVDVCGYASASTIQIPHLAVLARAGARLARYVMNDLGEAAERFSMEAGRYEE